jgi:hypothetical protein
MGMFRPSHPSISKFRRGVILVVVLALLALFALVGVSFVYYADAEAKAARIYREAEVQGRPDLAPELLLAFFLGQLIYDLDDQTGVYSALRGHSLARLLYGYNDQDLNATPWNGTGRLHTGPGTYMNPFNVDDYQLINYTYFPVDGFLRDPERLGMRAGLTQLRGAFTGGANVPYTYPDLNNMFLAAVKADGTVLLPSFHRPWTGFGSLDPSNSNWSTPSSVDPTLKYRVLRSRPADMGAGFPAPEDVGGDVKNLIGGPGGNDSIWLDLGAPVMLTPDGRKYKPLFAPLIVDLDNRVNVNVHGNVRGANGTHVSNQGWGPWEVNLAQVLGNGTEWTQLLLGRTAPIVYGRYGADQQPASTGSVASAGLSPHFYGTVDYDGCNEQNGYVSTAQLQLPGAGGPFSCFPTFPQGYGNGSTLEGTNHPSLYNTLKPAGDDRVFAVSNLEALLRAGDTGSAALTSELLRLCPMNFADARLRRLVTTRSYDIDKPGVTPWVWDPTAQPYLLAAGALAPSGAPIPFPSLTLQSGSLPTGSEFRTDWRASDATMGRVDLSAPLLDYPAPGVGGLITDLAGFQNAQQARQQLSGKIFKSLRKITGARDPTLVPSATPEYDALRWLAQLAVNIVDYIDTDDYLTPFFWNSANPAEVVLGTELPRVVINEAYAEWTPATTAGLPTTVQVWVELYNPFNTDPTLANNGDAQLAGAYLLSLCQPDPTPTYLRRPDNVWGTPYPINLGDPYLVYPQTTGGSDATVSDWTATPVLSASNGGTGPQGYYLVGPAAIAGGGPTPTNQRPEMQYQVQLGTVGAAPPAPTVLLQRLACPFLAPNPPPGGMINPSLPYNPFVTVDYMQNIDADASGVIRANNSTSHMPLSDRYSDGRNQPYLGSSVMKQLQAPNPPLTGQPQNSFFSINSQVQNPANFTWLVHLDRPLVSPMELLHVSAFKPHGLTQQFATASGSFQHYAPWFDQTARLYRLFEFLETHDRAAGVTPLLPGGRIPGKININTIWDPETLLAVCDPQPSNYFTLGQLYNSGNPSDPTTVWGQMISQRTPGLFSAGGPSAADRPFLGLATGFTAPSADIQNPNGIGIENTLLRSFSGSAPRLFENPNVNHPYLRLELLTKIFNHLTTRSNVFAVWVTVGFFEVMDDTSRPVKLGAEIGRAENRHIRHRMFAIVDRSSLDANFGPRPRFNPRADPALVPYFSIIQ